MIINDSKVKIKYGKTKYYAFHLGHATDKGGDQNH